MVGIALPIAPQIDLIMLPDEDGLALCRRIMAQSPIPAVLLTAVTGETDRIIGLEIGADDYVCKPFTRVSCRTGSEEARPSPRYGWGSCVSIVGVTMPLIWYLWQSIQS